MEAPRYPAGTLRALLASDHVTPATREVLVSRLDAVPKTSPRVFDDASFATLRAACDRLIPQPDRSTPIDLAGAVDDRLARNEGNGWRYATMPPDAEAYRLGLRGIDECAASMFGVRFVDLEARQQDDVLRSVQDGTTAGPSWMHVPAKRFFEELLAELVESYYSHPLGQEEIGYVGFADAHGWQAIGLDKLEEHEPRPVHHEREPDSARRDAREAPEDS
jgi:gluconate 2-dehydrogenase gamma chain